jgi:hypothetical protein
MFKNEDDFKKIVSRLNIDNKPNPVHRENLRRQMLSAFNEGQQPKSIWQSIIKSPITKLAAAAVIIIAIGIFVAYQGPDEQAASRNITEATKSPAEMLTVASLNAAYRKGELEAVENRYKHVLEVIEPWPSKVSITEVFEELNGS